MSRLEHFRDPRLASHEMILATDLDGTFLGGPEAARQRLYDWVEASRDTVGLIFVTGRDPGFLHELVETRGVPRPDFVIGDVGTTIARFDPDRGVVPLEELEAPIREAWAGKGPQVREALADWPGLSLQSTEFRHRVSYDLDPEAFDPAAKSVASALGLDWLVSDNRFFDVLPAGVSKGPSLMRLVAWLGVEPRKVLAAGDTLNDLSMLASPVPAVAVGNSEPALLTALAPRPALHLANAHGAEGIIEAIGALNLHSCPPA